MPSNPPISSNSSSTARGAVGNGTAITAATAAKKAQAARMALQQLHNQRVPGYFALSMAALILFFTMVHWSRFMYNRNASKERKRSSIVKFQVGIARALRHTLNRPCPGFTSVAHAVLVLVYLAINISLTVTNIDWSSLIGIAKRCGWIAITNVAFITFLALKNTPLAYLTAYSYERLNPLHQIGGYITVTYVLLHVTLMCESFNQLHFIGILIELPQIHGMIAASAVLIILATATIVRRMRYEVFYVTHIAMYMLILINVGFHRPEFVLKTIIITIFAASMWCSDRILRFCRILWYSYDNRATIIPLPNGGTRIVLRRSPSRVAPGTHCFLWIPRIRPGETHPFTIVTGTPYSLELVVASYDGFTKDLHKYAMQHPGASLRASIDGPYGTIPNFTNDADKVILIGGGSGASFTFGVALAMIRKLEGSAKMRIEFVWAVKEQESLSWFSKELSELQASPLVTIYLHTTRAPYSMILPSPPSPPSPIAAFDLEKNLPISLSPITETSTNPSSQFDIEKQPASPTTAPLNSSPSLNTVSGRPDINNVIRTAVRNASDTDRIAIAACGPDGMMKLVRSTAADCTTMKGPSVQLHCEQFGW